MTSITPEPGSGIISNQTAGDVVLSTDPSILQTRVTSSCPAGTAIQGINADGAVSCEATGTGTITGVTAGTGLTGGGTSGNVTLNVDFGTTTNQAASGDHTHAGIYQQKYGKVAVVAKSGGDYTDPVAAMADISTWCGMPSSTNPCLLKIMPGVYNIGNNSLQMQPYVDIEGSGENVTVVKGNVEDQASDILFITKGLVLGADNAELRFIKIMNTGPGNIIIAVLNNTASPKMTNVLAAATDGSSGNIGIYNLSSADAVVRNSSVMASGTSNSNWAILSVNSSPTMTNVTAAASGASFSNSGVSNFGSSTAMNNITAIASGAATVNYGVSNAFDPSPTMINITATASGGEFNYGVFNQNTDTRTTFVTMINVTATASGGVNNRGATEDQTSSRLMNVTATASGGSGMHIGILCTSASPVFQNATGRGTGGTYGYGLAGWGLVGPYTITADNSTFEGSTNSISASDQFTIKIAASKLIGPVYNLNTTNCINVYDGNTYTALDDSCQ